MERNGQFETNEGDIDESRRDFLRASAAGIAGAGLLSGAGTPVSASAKGSGDGGTTFLGTTNPAELYSRTDSGDWSQVGESILSGDGSVTDVVEFGGTVIAGTTTETGQGDGNGAVYAFDGDSWDQLGGDLDNEVTTLVTYEGDLYAGTSYGDARLYRYDRDGGWRLVLERTDWDGVGAARVADVGLDGTSESGIVLGDSLHDIFGVYTRDPSTGGDDFVQEADHGGSCIYDFATHDGDVFAGAWNGYLYRRNGGSWDRVVDLGYSGYLELASYDGDLYLGAADGTLYRYQGPDSSLATVHEFDDSVVGLEVTSGDLYVGTGQNAGEYEESWRDDGTATVFRYDGDGVARVSDEDQFGSAAQVLYRSATLSGSPSPSVSAKNTRIVQLVEDTRVQDGDGDDADAIFREDDPDLVAGRNSAVLFDLEPPITGASLPINPLTEIPIEVEREVSRQSTSGSTATVTNTFSISTGEYLGILQGDMTLADVIGGDGAVFELDEDVRSITVRIAPDDDDIETTAFTIENGRDFELSEQLTLTVGFIEVADPEMGDNYGYQWDENTTPDLVTRGGPLNYEETVEAAVERLERVYPAAEVRAYVHDMIVRGTDSSGDDWRDANDAHDALQDELPLDEDETLRGTGPIDSFDETVAIVPTLFGSNTDYFDYHGASGVIGRKWSNPSATLVLEAGEMGNGVSRSAEGAAETTAHELGHHFMDDPYEGPNGDPMAQRGDDGIDEEHSRHIDSDMNDNTPVDSPGVKSRGYDLGGGTFTTVANASSTMSYAGDTVWPDARMIQHLIEGELTPDYQTEADYRGAVLSGHGNVSDDGSVEFEEVRTTTDYAMAPDEDGAVVLSVRDAGGEALVETTVSDEIVGSHDGHGHAVAEGTVSFTVPYPEEAAVLEAERDGQTTRIVPHSSLLFGALDRVSDEAFDRNPEQRRGALENKLDAVHGQLEDGAYRGARQKLRNDVRGAVERWLGTDYETAANEYTRAELLALIDDQTERLETLHSGGGGNGNGGNRRGNGNGSGR